MNARQHLYYGLGQVLYSVALCDGVVQSKEENKMKRIVEQKFTEHEWDYECMEIAFFLMERYRYSNSSEVYELGIQNIRLGKHQLEEGMVSSFVEITEEIAKAFPPITDEEQKILNLFREDIRKIKYQPTSIEK